MAFDDGSFSSGAFSSSSWLMNLIQQVKTFFRQLVVTQQDVEIVVSKTKEDDLWVQK